MGSTTLDGFHPVAWLSEQSAVSTSIIHTKMARILLGIIAVVASVMLADSLICNSCSLSVVGVCLNSANTTCTNSTASCFTATSTLPSITAFTGFSSQGCLAGCTAGTTNTSLLSVTMSTAVTCCTTDNCNPVTISGAPTSKLSLTAALGAAVLASVWGTMMY